jgi:hypothetical protein
VTQSCRRSITVNQVDEGFEEGFHMVELLNLRQNIQFENRLRLSAGPPNMITKQG